MAKKKRKRKTSPTPNTLQKSFISPKTIPIKKEWSWIVMVTIGLFGLYFWWPTRELPYHWDSAGFIIRAAREFLATNFSPLVANFSEFAHPPFFIALLALTWKFFGNTILVSHLLMLGFWLLLLFSTFFLAKKITNTWGGLGSAILVGSTPVVLAELGVIYLDLTMAALATTVLALWIYNRRWIAGIMLTLAVLTKMPAVLLIVPLALTEIVNLKKTKIQLSNFYPLFLPLAALLIWLQYHFEVAGWWLTIPGRGSAMPNQPIEIWQSFVYVSKRFLLDQHRWTLLLSIIGSIGYLIIYLKKDWKSILLEKSWILLASTVIIGLLFFIILGEFGLRYSIFLLPAYVTVGFLSLYTAFKNDYLLIGFTVISFLLFSQVWHPKMEQLDTWFFRPFEDQGYLDVISIGRQAATYLEINHSNDLIYGAFPENYQLTMPFQGYVNEPLSFFPCSKFELILDKNQIIYVQPFSPQQMACLELINTYSVSPVNRFEENGKWVELFKVEATESAQPAQESS